MKLPKEESVFYISILLLLYLLPLCFADNEYTQPNLTALTEQQQGSYTLPPNLKQDGPSRDLIGIMLTYAKLLEVDPPRQQVTMIFEYTLLWRDERLQWDPADFDDIDHIYVQRNRVWIPEVTPFDSTDAVDTRPDYKQFSSVSYNGWASFYSSNVASLNCDMDMDNFPFDSQNCSVKLLSYTFDTTEIELKNEIFKGLLSEEIGNDEWRVMNITARSALIYEQSSPTQLNEFTFVMKRNPSYYISLIIVPSFIQTTLCIAAMFTSRLKLDDTPKLSMGLTSIMSTAVTISTVSDAIPKAEKIPKLTNFVLLNLIMLSSAIGVVIIVPKIGQILGLFLRCRKNCCLRRWSWLIGGLCDFSLFCFFEGVVVFNGLSLLANDDVAKYVGIAK